MAKRISNNIVFGNAIICNYKDFITKDEIYEFYYRVDNNLPNSYYTYDEYTFDSFCEDYGFLFEYNENMIFIPKNKEKLIRHFRIGIPTELLKVFDECAKKRNIYKKVLNLRMD